MLSNPIIIRDLIWVDIEVFFIEVTFNEEAVIDYQILTLRFQLTLIFSPSIIALSRIEDSSHKVKVLNLSQIAAQLEQYSSSNCIFSSYLHINLNL